MLQEMIITVAQPAKQFISSYSINETYLRAMGFEKNEVLSSAVDWIYWYYRPMVTIKGIELAFNRTLGILTIEEFWLCHSQEEEYVARNLIGNYKIDSDEDLRVLHRDCIGIR